MRLFLCFLVPLLLLIACGRGGAGNAQSDLIKSKSAMNAPDFPSGLEWLNTDRPLKMADLRGKVVLLDFWTYCCINCMHIIPNLKRLEKEWPDELVVIGVHSAKFTQEGETANIRQAILRYEIEHPVINDRRFVVWQSYNARAWPTVVLIDPEGRVVINHAGEGVYGRFAQPIKQLVETYDKQGKIDRKPLNLKKEASVEAEGYLAYPGKVLVAPLNPASPVSGEVEKSDATSPTPPSIEGGESKGEVEKSDATSPTPPSIEGGEKLAPMGLIAPMSLLVRTGKPEDDRERVLFISDQNHNRIVVTDLNGKTKMIIGSGRLGFKDGSFEEAELNHPQGIALVGNTLYIADTENHAVRAADLNARQVTTLAGNGDQALGWGASGGKGRDVALSSPWDLASSGDSLLYVAMAGTHQIWTIQISDGYAQPFAGSSQEGLNDGPRRRAALAQPSGLAILGDRLYFADSEVSAIRYVELGEGEGQVGTVVGEDLFEFGDKDGVGGDVRLQHPLGVTTDGKLLYVADTYNSKVKVIDPKARSSKTIFGDGKPGFKDGKGPDASLYEPGGISFADGRLYIADTNNGKIRVADLASLQLTTLSINANADENTKEEIVAANAKEQRVGAGKGTITVEISVPEGMKINQESQVVLSLVEGGGVARGVGVESVSYMPEGRKKFSLPVEWLAGAGEVVVEVNYVYCGEKDATVCWPGKARLKGRVVVMEGLDGKGWLGVVKAEK